MMRVLLTGSTGFVGARAVEALLQGGHDVAAMVRSASAEGAHIDEDRRFVYDGSFASVDAAIAGFAPHAVVHLATHFVAKHEVEDLRNLVDCNIQLGLHLLEAMSRREVRSFVNFGTFWQRPTGERSEPTSLYAVTKQAFDDILKFYCGSLGLKAINLLLTDTYGPADKRRKLIPRLCEIAKDRTHLALSPGEQLINIVHVDDVASALGRALERVVELDAGSCEHFWITGPRTMPLKEMVQVFERVNGVKLNLGWGEVPYRKGEIMTPWFGPPLPRWGPAIPIEKGFMGMLTHAGD